MSPLGSGAAQPEQKQAAKAGPKAPVQPLVGAGEREPALAAVGSCPTLEERPGLAREGVHTPVAAAVPIARVAERRAPVRIEALVQAELARPGYLALKPPKARHKTGKTCWWADC